MWFFRNLKFLLIRNKKLVGKDAFNNRYYQACINGKIKRWVIYHGTPDPSIISAEWHIWLHYTDDKVPSSSSSNDHLPNLTGTKYAYYPNKFLLTVKNFKNKYQSI